MIYIFCLISAAFSAALLQATETNRPAWSLAKTQQLQYTDKNFKCVLAAFASKWIAVVPEFETKAVGVWDKQGKFVKEFNLSQNVSALTFDKANHLAIAYGDVREPMNIVVHDLQNGSEVFTTKIKGGWLDEIKRLAFNPKKKQLAAGNRDGRVFVIDFEKPETAEILYDRYDSSAHPDERGIGIRVLEYAPDGNKLVMGNFGGVTFRDMNTEKTVSIHAKGFQVITDAAFNNKGDKLAISWYGSGLVAINDIEGKGSRVVYESPEDSLFWPRAIACDTTDRFMAVAEGGSNSTFVMDLNNNNQRTVLTEPNKDNKSYVKLLSFQDDDLVALREDGVLQLWHQENVSK